MKKFLIFAVVGILIVSIVACGSDDETATKVDGEKKEVENVENKEFSVGESIELKGNQLTVTNAEKIPAGEYDYIKEGNEYLVTTVEIKNNGSSNVSYNPYDFKLKNSNGNMVDVEFVSVNQNSRLESGELAPDGTVSGTLAFEAPIGDDNLQLIYTPSFWSDKNITVNLQ